MKLEVSFGEAVDKLTILEIKKRKIADENKRVEVAKEYDYLFENLKRVLQGNILYLCSCLTFINEKIWDMQDEIRDCKNVGEEHYRLCISILEYNDMRFRIKNKINCNANSNFKEQKGYNAKKALLLPHLGLGDEFTMVGAVRELSLRYDEVIIVSKTRNKNNVQVLYEDDPSIRILDVESDIMISPNFGCKNSVLTVYKSAGYDILLCGMHKNALGTKVHNLNKEKVGNRPFWEQFYYDIGLNYHDRFIYSYVSTNDRQIDLFNKLASITGEKREYIFIHDKKGINEIKNIQCDDDTYIFNVNNNYYQADHKFGKLWPNFSDPIMNFKLILENAKEIHLINSSYLCFASLLDLSKVNKKVIYLFDRKMDLSTYFKDFSEWKVV